jgi:hypothetical protein
VPLTAVAGTSSGWNTATIAVEASTTAPDVNLATGKTPST